MAIEKKYRTCSLCEALCGLEIEVEENKILSIRGDEKDVFSKGHICPKAVALKDIHEDPDRLKKPLRKIDGEWQEVSWKNAIDYTAQRLYEIQQKEGIQSLGIYQGNPSIHNLGTALFSPHLVRLLKTTNRFSATSVDQLAHHLAGEFMLGHANLVALPDIDRTDCWVIMGGNPMVSNGSLMTAADIRGRMRAIQSRDGKIIVIDPRRTETADKSDQHIFIKPGTDVFLVLGMINYILNNNLINLRHIQDLVSADHISRIQVLTDQFNLSTVASITGVGEQTIRELINQMIESRSAVLYGRLGVSACEYGGLSHWAINTYNILTGNFDRPGGAMLPSPAIKLANKPRSKPKFRRWHSRVRNLPEFGGELPSSTMADEILTPGVGQIKAMLTSCGNPVLSVPNGQRLDVAFESLDFMVCIDIYLNETTRHADVILPPATGVETPHFGIAFQNLSVRNHANFSDAAVEKEEGTKFDYEIFLDLHKAYASLALSEEEASKFNFLYHMTPEIMVEQGLAAGKSGISLSDLKANPHGIDLGPLETQFPNNLLTHDKKIDLLPDIYREQLSALKLPDNSGKFSLIGRRHLRSNNSWLHNVDRMVKGPERCTLLIHPDDASNLNVVDGQQVVVTSDINSVKINTEVSDEIMPGTVSIPHGWGHWRQGIKMNIAAEHAGVSLNDLIDDQKVDELSGVSIITGIPVSIAAE